MDNTKSILIIFFLLFIATGCNSKKKSLTIEEAKLLCERVEVMYNNANEVTVKETLDSTFVLYSPLFPMPARGIDAFAYNIKSNLRSFPDFKLTIDSFFVKDDNIYSFWTKKGTNTGPLGRMPTTGKTINISGFSISKVKEGKIIEEHNYWNVLEFYTQLGFQIIPPEFEATK